MLRLLILFVTIALSAQFTRAAEDAESPQRVQPGSAEGEQQSDVSSGGGVILDGRYIAPPYRVVAVAEGVELNGNFVPEDGFNERARRTRESSQHLPFADRILERLDDGAWLLGWQEGEYGMLSESRMSDVLNALSTDSSDGEKIDELEEIDTPWIERANWRQLVEQCELPPNIVGHYAPLPTLDPKLVAQVEAPVLRFKTSIYLLTVCGMGATVFALGTLLSYRPSGRMPWSCVNVSKDATHLVLRSVALLIGLAVLDLVCTTISARTASFWELNPFGSAALTAPLVLGSFKIGATLMSGSILLALRRYHGAQVASWWLALFCTVLAMRWVTFNSMFLT